MTTVVTTNERLSEALSIIDELIDWAEADAEHAAENNALSVAADDRTRANRLRRCRALLETCTR